MENLKRVSLIREIFQFSKLNGKYPKFVTNGEKVGHGLGGFKRKKRVTRKQGETETPRPDK